MKDVRALFPALGREVDGKRLVYLDSACTALKSRAVSEAVARFYSELGACGGKRSTHLLAQEVERHLSEARRAAAEFLNAETPAEIVFTSGTTESANLVARAFPYEPSRREVILTDLEHNAVFLPFYEAARRGEVELRFHRTKEARIDPAALSAMITPRTALVCVTRASNVAGGAQPLGEVIRAAHKQGARVFIDDAQFLSSHREDVRALNADFVAFSAHKLGGPFGLGVLYGKEQELNRLGCYKVGGGAVKSVVWRGERPEVEYLDAPMRFEPGVANFAAFPGLTAALELLGSWPEKELRAHVGGLVRRLCARLAAIPSVRVVGRPEHLAEGALVSFAPAHPEFSAQDFNLFLNHELPGRFVAVRAGEHCAHLLHQSLGLEGTIRASFFAYNTAEDVDVLADAVESYAREACAA